MATRRNTVQLELATLPSTTPEHLLFTPEGEEPPSLYSSPVFHGYSLWLCPSAGEDDTFLKSVIAEQAAEIGTDAFPPHLTVVAAMHDLKLPELLKRMEMFEKRLGHNFDDIFVPTMHLHAFGARDLFFQCVYAHPVITKSISAINTLAVDVFDREGNGCGYEGAYMPHLSVVYGDVGVDVKATAMSHMAPKIIGKSFNFGSLQLWRTEGLHTEWKCMRTVTLPLPYENKTLPRSVKEEAQRGSKRLFRSQSTELRESSERVFQDGTMTRREIMQWATARKALIAAHMAGMKQLRGARKYEIEQKLSGIKSNASITSKIAESTRKLTIADAAANGRKHTVSTESSGSWAMDGEQLSLATEEDDTDGEHAAERRDSVSALEEHGEKQFFVARQISMNVHNEGHGLVLKQLRMRTKSAEINKVIQKKIKECTEISGEDEDHAHPILTVIANYDFDSGIASAGMSWGIIGHAVKHTLAGDDGEHGVLTRRSSTGMIGKYGWAAADEKHGAESPY
jgi:hypothetical protein